MDHRTIFVAGISFVLIFGLVAFATAIESEHEELDIVETAIADGSFEIALAALEAAGLVDLLKGDGPFTVFAPTDDALAALPEGELERLLEPENKAELQGIVKYHVVAEELTSGEIAEMDSAVTLHGDEVTISVEDGNVKIDEATVIMADIECKNGVVHVIDAVLSP